MKDKLVKLIRKLIGIRIILKKEDWIMVRGESRIGTYQDLNSGKSTSFWRCECGRRKIIGSVEELEKKV